MAKQQDYKTTSEGIAHWMKTYRKLVFLIGFLLLVPIVSVTTFYVVTYRRYRLVEFSQGEQRNFQTMQVSSSGQYDDTFVFNTGHVTVTILLNSYELSQHTVGGEGFFNFDISFTVNEGQSISPNQITVGLIVQADWQDARSTQVNRTINQPTPARNVNIIFNDRINPSIWFVNRSHPNLYVRVQYTVAGEQVVKFGSGDLVNLGIYVEIPTLPDEE